MPTELTEERLAELPGLLEQAERRVNAHVFRTGHDDSLASIPANRNRDVDLLLMEAANAIRKLLSHNGESGWISVKDRLPDECTTVLALFDDSYGGSYLLVSREGEKWFDESPCADLREAHDITHWKPLGPPPLTEVRNG